MKILFDATELSYYEEESGHRAGVFYVALNLLKEFQKLGIDITFCCDFKRYYFLRSTKYFHNIPVLKEYSLMNKFIGKVIYLTRKFPIRFKYALLILARYYDAWFYVKNKKNMEQLKNFDVYFSPFTPPSKEIQESDIKRFRMIHDTIPILEHGFPKSPKDWYYKIYKSLNSEDYYLTNSEQTKSDVLKYFSFIKDSHIKTTLLGANEKFYKTTKNANIDTQYIFSLCTLGKRKNLEFIIRNFFEFTQKNNIENLKLVLGGGIWKKYEHELNSILAQHDRSKIILTGYIKEEDLKKYYSNALCFVYPSLYEGFGLPVLEAMQCGCPVITSNTSSLPEVIGECGIKITPTNNSEMIEAFEKIYFNKELRESFSQQGLERSKFFSWEKCAFTIIDFIKST